MNQFEGLSWNDSIWLTMTSLTTVGYGDYSAQTVPGRISTIILIYGLGIYLLAHLVDSYISYHQLKHEKIATGKWNWDMKNHLLIIGAPAQQPEIYFDRLFSQLRDSDKFGQHEVLVLLDTNAQHLLPRIKPILDENKAKFMVQNIYSDQSLVASDAGAASHIFLLAKDEDKDSDASSFDLVYRLRKMNKDTLVISETLQDECGERLKSVGASCVLRPMRAYPEMVVRALVAPGSEAILCNLFSSHGDECQRFDLKKPFTLTWLNVVTKY